MADLYGLNAPLEDVWLRLDDDTPAPAGERLLVSLARLRRDGAALAADATALAVTLAPDVDVEDIAALLPSLAMVELEFPSFADGRAFSQARELRERFAYAGDIRASGEVLRDQLGFMARCGFNQFDLSREQAVSIPAALAEIRYAYQPSGLMPANSPASGKLARLDGGAAARRPAAGPATPRDADGATRKVSNS